MIFMIISGSYTGLAVAYLALAPNPIAEALSFRGYFSPRAFTLKTAATSTHGLRRTAYV